MWSDATWSSNRVKASNDSSAVLMSKRGRTDTRKEAIPRNNVKKWTTNLKGLYSKCNLLCNADVIVNISSILGSPAPRPWTSTTAATPMKVGWQNDPRTFCSPYCQPEKGGSRMLLAYLTNWRVHFGSVKHSGLYVPITFNETLLLTFCVNMLMAFIVDLMPPLT